MRNFLTKRTVIFGVGLIGGYFVGRTWDLEINFKSVSKPNE